MAQCHFRLQYLKDVTNVTTETHTYTLHGTLTNRTEMSIEHDRAAQTDPIQGKHECTCELELGWSGRRAGEGTRCYSLYVTLFVPGILNERIRIVLSIFSSFPPQTEITV